MGMIDNSGKQVPAHSRSATGRPADVQLLEFCGLLKVLANPNRLLILRLLLDGEQSVGQIERKLAIRQPTLSNELGALRRRSLVTTRRDSRVIHYSLAPGTDRTRLSNLLAELDPTGVGRTDTTHSPYPLWEHRGECGHFAEVASLPKKGT